jgi:hypothetical protein
MPLHVPFRQTRTAIDQWIELAQQASRHEDVGGERHLKTALRDSRFIKEAKVTRHHLVEFKTASPSEEPKVRRMYQVDALATRALELLGAEVSLRPSGGGNVWEVDLRIAGLGHTTLGRILWGVPSSATLREDRESDYHDYIPTTFSVGWGIDRNDILLFAAEQADGVDIVLDDLFSLHRRFYGNDLRNLPRRRVRVWRRPKASK